MNHPSTVLAVTVLALSLSGCSGEDDTPTKDDHVFKEKTQAIDKARDVANVLKDGAARQSEAAK
jgi:PBP1b-binding outer membrane lipoprotein LpoB